MHEKVTFESQLARALGGVTVQRGERILEHQDCGHGPNHTRPRTGTHTHRHPVIYRATVPACAWEDRQAPPSAHLVTQNALPCSEVTKMCNGRRHVDPVRHGPPFPRGQGHHRLPV